jgi:hypothetical protein
MYHIEIRQFPHNMNRFNLSASELGAIVEPWSQERFVDVGERKWNPQTAKLIVLEGPELPFEQLSMGRGWRLAERESEDVTERILSAAAEVVAAGRAAELQEAARAIAQQPPAPAAPAAADPAPSIADSEIGDVVFGLLGDNPQRLLGEWRSAAGRAPGLSPSESLALAEHALRTADA